MIDKPGFSVRYSYSTVKTIISSILSVRDSINPSPHEMHKSAYLEIQYFAVSGTLHYFTNRNFAL
jgi:hypothetical protein